ncbi:MAG: hypothetical protein BVN35_06130 [Proteobacteria bacterium ST_bin11]|nr:MAG: hypothetical protein BVN35_06130 [Proteobacteria bacterium ST_bin11]
MATTAELGKTFLANPPAISIGGDSVQSSPFTSNMGSMTNFTPIQPWENRRTTLWTMPSNYIMDPSNNIKNTFILQLLTTNNFLVNYIFPMKVTNDITFAKNQMIFGPHLPDQVPHLGVVRYIKSRMQSSTQSLIRYGLGFTMEHEFMKTPTGATALVFAYKQIGQAFIEHMQLSVIVAMLNADDWERNRLEKINGADNYGKQTEKIMEREKDFWAFVQQESKNAWMNLDTNVDEQHSQYSQAQLNTWIVDYRVTGYVRRIPDDQTKFLDYGPGNQQNVRSGIEYFRLDEKGNRCYSTRSFLCDGQIINSLQRIAQIGEYYLCADRPGLNFKSLYESQDRSVHIYSDESNSWVEVRLDQFIKNSQRFTKKGTLKTTNDLYHTDAGKSRLDDDFLYHTINDHIVPKTFFGQFKHEHYNIDDQRHLGETVISSVKIGDQPLLAKAFAALQECVETMHVESYSPNYRKYLGEMYDQVSQSTLQTFQDRVTGSLAYVGNDHNSLDVTTGTSFRLPPTHASYGGFKTIQTIASMKTPEGKAFKNTFSSHHIDLIKAYLPVFESYVDKLVKIFPNSAILKSQWASPYVHNPSPRDTAFENLILRQFPALPIYFNLGTDESTIQGSSIYAGIEELERLALQINQAVQRSNLVSDVKKNVQDIVAVSSRNIFTYATALLKVLWLVLDYKNVARTEKAFAAIESRIQASREINVLKRDETLYYQYLSRFRQVFDAYPEYIEITNVLADNVQLAVTDRGGNGAQIMMPLTMGAVAYKQFVEECRRGNTQTTTLKGLVAVSRFDTYAPLTTDPAALQKESAAIDDFMLSLQKYRTSNSEDPSCKVHTLPMVSVAAITQRASILSETKSERAQRLLRKPVGNTHNHNAFASIMSAGSTRERRSYQSGALQDDRMTPKKLSEAFFDPNESISHLLDDTDVGDELTQDFIFNFARACTQFSAQPEILFSVIAFFWTPITEQAFMASYEYNTHHPVNYIIVRPHQTYYTQTAIKCIPGDETGNSYIAHVNIEVGNDPTTQVYDVAMRAYMGAGVNNSENIYVAPNIMVNGYLFGAGVGFCEPDKYNPMLGINGSGNGASIISMMAPRNVVVPSVFSTTGTLSWTDPQGTSTIIREGLKYSYPVAPFYNRIWAFNQHPTNDPAVQASVSHKKNKMFTANSVCYSGCALYNDQITKKPDWGTVPTGHWRQHLIGAGKYRQRIGKDPVTSDHALLGKTTFSFHEA